MDLWRRVTDTAVPLDPDRAPPPAPAPEHEPPAPAPWPDRPAGPAERATPLRRARPARPALDARRMEKLRRGALRPEARIDLHGMTLSQAKPALTGFIMRAESEGRRLVLVITGKGGPEGRGALRRQVPHWLRLAPLSALVLETVQAHHRDGGGGALYVYLRRRR